MPTPWQYSAAVGARAAPSPRRAQHARARCSAPRPRCSALPPPRAPLVHEPSQAVAACPRLLAPSSSRSRASARMRWRAPWRCSGPPFRCSSLWLQSLVRSCWTRSGLVVTTAPPRPLAASTCLAGFARAQPQLAQTWLPEGGGLGISVGCTVAGSLVAVGATLERDLASSLPWGVQPPGAEKVYPQRNKSM